jgi:hypothetical protein
MYIPFEELPIDSKIWIYPTNRKLSDQEVEEINIQTLEFVNNWVAHDTPLHASFKIKYNRFLILAVDQEIQHATGCSIDKSVVFIQSLEQKYGIDLLDKMNVTYKQGENITHKSLIDFKKIAKEKAVTKNTIVFNNLVNTIGEWHEYWEVPASESWHQRLF